jgi:carbonic anhydrase
MIFILVLAYTALAGTYSSSGEDWTGTCALGTAQSPINLADAKSYLTEFTSPEYLPVVLDFKADITKAVDTALTYELTGNFGFIRVSSDKSYAVSSIVLHAPCEHPIEGTFVDLEMHIMAQTASGETLVLAVQWSARDNKSSSFLKDVVAAESTLSSIDLSKAFATPTTSKPIALTDFFEYTGSLTVPPCTEGVQWLVLAARQSMSIDQMFFFTNRWQNNFTFAGGNGNNRAVQEQNGRIVTHYLPETPSKTTPVTRGDAVMTVRASDSTHCRRLTDNKGSQEGKRVCTEDGHNQQ